MGLGQVVAALPWLALLFWQDVKQLVSRAREPREIAAPKPKSGVTLPVFLGGLVGATVLLGAIMAGVLAYLSNSEWIVFGGRIYGSILHLQLAIDLVIILFVILLALWPKAGAVALSAFRESIRQLMFLILMAAGFLMILASVVIPYFTFGEDYKMMQDLGYDTIMLVAVLFCCLTASISISEEIEGRTAVTLMSKPVSRRQFLLGKFVGLLMVAVLITTLLGWWFDWMLFAKRFFEHMDQVEYYKNLGYDYLIQPPQLSAAYESWPRKALDFLRGVGLWLVEAGGTFPGLFLGCCQAMILLAAAVSLATRLPMVVNLTICGGLYFLGHLTPILKQIARSQFDAAPGSPVNQMLLFMSQVFDALLPSLEFFNLGAAVIRDTPMPVGPFLTYVGSVGLYGIMYTMILLMGGLVLFEDRDLA